MIRILTLAAAAAALIAMPAAAESIRISTAGKSAEQLHAEIRGAAHKICRREISPGATFPQDELAGCIRATVADAVAQAHDPALAALAKLQLAQR